MQKKIRALYYIGAEKITFPPKSDGRTDGHTDRNKKNFSLIKILNEKKISSVANIYILYFSYCLKLLYL